MTAEPRPPMYDDGTATPRYVPAGNAWMCTAEEAELADLMCLLDAEVPLKRCPRKGCRAFTAKVNTMCWPCWREKQLAFQQREAARLEKGKHG